MLSYHLVYCTTLVLEHGVRVKPEVLSCLADCTRSALRALDDRARAQRVAAHADALEHELLHLRLQSGRCVKGRT